MTDKLSDERLAEIRLLIKGHSGGTWNWMHELSDHIATQSAEIARLQGELDAAKATDILRLVSERRDFKERAETAEAALDAAREQERWIPVSERLPLHEPIYFAEISDADPNKTVVVCGWYKPENVEDYRWWGETDRKFVAPERILAWMPRAIPAAPTPEGELYRVAWAMKDGGNSGHGELMSKELAQAWADSANKEHPDISHWAEQATPEGAE